MMDKKKLLDLLDIEVGEDHLCSSVLQDRYHHGSATVVDKVTKAKIPMVTGGYNGGTLDSTELLINGQWQCRY